MALAIHRAFPPPHRRYHTDNASKDHVQFKGNFFDSLAIYRTVGQLSGSLRALASVPLRGSVLYSVENGVCRTSGEVTCFSPSAEEALHRVIATVESIGSSLESNYPMLGKVEVEFSQTCEFEP